MFINWDNLRAGQVRPYGDSIYRYRVMSDSPMFVVSTFCRKVLKPCENECLDDNQYTGSCSFPFALNSFYKFEMESPGVYIYTVCEPWTG